MPKKTGIAIGDHEMSFALLHVDSRSKFCRTGAGCIDDEFSREFNSITEQDATFSETCNRSSQHRLSAMLLCPLHQKARGAGGIEDCILGHKEAALQSVTKIRLNLLQALRIQDLGGNSAISVEIVLARYLAHLLFISCNPDRAALVILYVRGQFVPENLPELLRVPGQGELRLGVVHHDYVSHAGASGAAAHNFAINDCNSHVPARK